MDPEHTLSVLLDFSLVSFSLWLRTCERGKELDGTLLLEGKSGAALQSGKGVCRVCISF